MGVSRANCALKETVKSGITDLAHKCNLDKVILFGSRARGANRERNDIDLAIQGGDKYHLKSMQEKRTIISNDTPIPFSL